MAKIRFAGLIVLMLAACGKEPATPAPEPAAPVAPAFCRPADVAPGTLDIGPLSFGPGEARMEVTEDGGFPALSISLEADAAADMARLTADLIGQPLALRVDGQTLMEPIVREPILDGRLQVSGRFSRAELEAIARRFAPPCPPVTPP